jgi:DNA-binding NarL/FixJ family response regulator
MVVGLLLVSDATLTRLGLTAALQDDQDIKLVATVGSAAQGRLAAAELHPDVVAVDVALPDADGLRFAAQLRERSATLGVVLLAPRDDDRLVRSLEAGISAYVPANAPIGVLLSAFRHAAVAPTSFTAPDLARALARHRRQQQLLSPRETEVLRLLHAGANVPRIAAALLVTESTVKTYLSRLYDKLGVSNRAEALAEAGRAGLIPEARPS